ncbi:MAG: glycosyltransferase family 39 protein [Bacteroidota bacterium]|nr:glycosyltransferase family 39 protein [Bacteroidota bacterium]
MLASAGTILGSIALIPRLLFAMQMDQSFHHYLGWTLLHGGLPYVASFDQNFPGGAFIYALAILLFGTSALGFATFDLLVQILTCWLIARLARRLDASGVAALFAPLLYAFTYIGLGVWDTGQRDCFVAPMLVFYAIQLLRTDRDEHVASAWGWAGLMLGAMLLVRPLMVLAGIPALWYLFTQRRETTRRSLLVFALSSVLLPLAIIFFYLIVGHVGELFEATILFNLEVYGKFRHGVTFRGSGVMTYFYFAGLALVFFQSHDRRPLMLLLALCFVAPISTFIQGQGDAHHFVPTYSIACVLAALGFAGLISWSRQNRFAIVALLMVLLGFGATRLPMRLLRDWHEGKSLEAIYADQQRGQMNLRDELATGRYLKAHTFEGDYIQIFAMRIWPYQLSGRSASSRFQSNEHLLMHPIEAEPLTPLQQSWRAEFLRDLTRHPPVYVLVTTDDHLWMLPHGESSMEQIKRFPEFESLIEKSYTLDTTIGSYKLFRRHSAV